MGKFENRDQNPREGNKGVNKFVNSSERCRAFTTRVAGDAIRVINVVALFALLKLRDENVTPTTE